MTPRMTIYEFAQRIGVSIGTVSRALNGRSGVSAQTRDMVLRRMKELGFRPNRAGRALAGGPSHEISLWVPGLSNSYAMAVIQAMWAQTRAAGYELLIRESVVGDRWERQLGEIMRASEDGMVVLDGANWLPQLLDKVGRLPIPAVSMGVYCPELLDRVVVDLTEGTWAAVRYLAETGCKRIAYMVPPWHDLEDNSRSSAYRKAVAQLGMPEEVVSLSEFSREGAAALLKRHIEKYGHPDGLFCFNDDCALGAYRALLDLGLRVPEDVSIIGCDGIPDTEYLEKPLSTIVMPLKEMCRKTWELLERRMRAPDIPLQKELIVPRLAIRASVRARTGAKAVYARMTTR
jgi:LacI family transcriptional regulator